MILLVVFFLLAIGFSFLCSILEAVLLSITPYYVAIQQQEGSRLGSDLGRFKRDIDKPLAAILTLNTFANTLGAVGVGAQASVVFGATRIKLLGVEFLSWEALIAGSMTLCILVFSEVIPKTIGANNWESLAPFAVRTLRVMLVLLSPFVWLAQFITHRLKHDKSKPVLSRADFLKMTNLGKESGIIGESEGRIIRNLLRFNHILVEDVMTPSTVVVTASDHMSVREFHEAHANLPFSRVPVYRDGDRSIIGYVHKDDLLIHLVDKNDQILLGDISKDMAIVKAKLPIPDLLDVFLHQKEHMALVRNDDDDIVGIVTMEDVIETVLGLEFEDDDETRDWPSLAREQWQNRIQKMGIKADALEPLLRWKEKDAEDHQKREQD